MFFRNLTLMRFTPAVALDLARLEEAIADHRLRACGPMELGTTGFVPPVGRGEDAALTHAVQSCTAATLGTESRLLPAGVINDELRRRVEKIAEEEDRRVGGRERNRLKEDVLTDLVPRAFVRSARVAMYVDRANGWMAINTASRKVAEMVVSQIREALGSFPVVPLAPKESPRVLMTDWLANGELPAGLALGDECELRDPATATGAITTSRRQELDSDEMKEHLRNGKQVFKLGLVFDERMTFVLGEDLVVSKLKFLDVVTDELGDSHPDAQAEADSTFALMTLELQRLLGKFEEWFGLEIDAPLHLHRQDAPLGMRIHERAVREAAAAIDGKAQQGDQTESTFVDSGDSLLGDAIRLVRERDRASISLLQRHFRIGYNRAARLIETMEAQGVVSAPEANGSRDVIGVRAAD